MYQLPPKADAHTVGGRLTVEVESDTVEYGRARAVEVRRAPWGALRVAAARRLGVAAR
ncbi:hypothetical protein [Nocardia sp. CC227C]|uniref:hypothetical protein n=1 Tax=Nocardia sp. CC227C TaxID=3044562 RepID=UPI00278BF959|nr:hypothetical protein [Nocardia sp. CC227C]